MPQSGEFVRGRSRAGELLEKKGYSVVRTPWTGSSQTRRASVLPGSAIETRLRAEQLRLLYSSVAKAIAATVLNTSIIVYMFWKLLPQNVLFTWLAGNWAIAGLAFVLVRVFRRDARREQRFELWRRLMVLRLLAAGLAFSSLTALFTTAQPLAHQAFYFFVCGGMVSGAAGVYSVRIEMFATYGLAVVVPLTLRLFTFSGELYFAMGVMVALFFAIVASSVRTMHETTVEALILRFENDELVKRISEEKTLTEQANRELELARDELWGEMQLARKIQTALMPKNPCLPDYELAIYAEPAAQVGGDYHDVFVADGQRWVFIGDVSGHGVPAGLVMMMAQTAIRALLVHSPALSPAELVVAVNGVLSHNISRLGDEKYMTLTVIALDDDGRCRFAGLHQDLLIHRQATKSVEVVPTEGMWVGLEADIREMTHEGVFQLERGDTLLLYTDGITEAKLKAPDGGQSREGRYGIDQLRKHLASLAPGSASAIRDGLVATLASYDTTDDVTVVVMRRGT